jgi:hypothetical protein
MSLAVFDDRDDTMAWMGVGNVAGTLWSPRSSTQETLLLRGGVVGDRLPRLQPSVVPVTVGDTLVLATDGVRGTIDRRVLEGSTPQVIADGVLRQSTDQDDALTVVARYRGSGT